MGKNIELWVENICLFSLVLTFERTVQVELALRNHSNRGLPSHHPILFELGLRVTGSGSHPRTAFSTDWVTRYRVRVRVMVLTRIFFLGALGGQEHRAVGREYLSLFARLVSGRTRRRSVAAKVRRVFAFGRRWQAAERLREGRYISIYLDLDIQTYKDIEIWIDRSAKVRRISYRGGRKQAAARL